MHLFVRLFRQRSLVRNEPEERRSLREGETSADTFAVVRVNTRLLELGLPSSGLNTKSTGIIYTPHFHFVLILGGIDADLRK